ncbi:hypothetical protein DFS34DRAFT_646430 [Phlyctochytrium arcticum]|nr:hypothetical protein DFS34DRAFT_646430 [Phlyctochytrium arcticum]
MSTSPEPAESIGIKNDLCDSLGSFQAPGTFAAFKTIPQSSIAPFLVRDVGIIPFPLTEVYARKLIDKARLAPFGKGEETVVDTSIRNTWELDASRFDFLGNEKWVKIINAASTWVAKELGITGPLKVEPYKMLIYEPGALFKPHTDTEKIPGMFGTLVIALPSGHTGGDLFVKHPGEGKIFTTSTIQPCMLSWYSEVSHEFLPVTSGYRWVITFNLATSVAVPRPSFDLPPGYDDIQKALRKWIDFRKSDEWDGTLYSPFYILDSYKETSISLNTLKGIDRLRMQALKRACEEENVSLYFGIIEKSESGSWEESEEEFYPNRYGDCRCCNDNGGDRHDLTEIHESSYSVEKLVATDGKVLIKNVDPIWVDISGNNSIQNFKNPLAKFARGEEEYSGITENEEITTTHWFRATVAIIVPTDIAEAFLETTEIEGYEQGPKKCEKPSNFLFNPMLSDHSVLALEVLEVSLRHRQYQLINCTLKWLTIDGKFKIPPLAIFSMIKRTVAEGLLDFARIKHRLLEVWMKCTWDVRTKLLTAIAPLQEKQPQICAWIADDIFTEVINACEVGKVTEAVGTRTSSLVTQYQDVDYFKTRIVPIIQGKASFTPFALAALVCIMRHVTPEGLNKDEYVKVCKPLMKSVIEALDATNLCSSTLAAPQHASAIDEQRMISTTILVDCLLQCHQVQWDDLSTHFCNKIVEKANGIPPVQLRDLWIPFCKV